MYAYRRDRLRRNGCTELCVETSHPLRSAGHRSYWTIRAQLKRRGMHTSKKTVGPCASKIPRRHAPDAGGSRATPESYPQPHPTYRCGGMAPKASPPSPIASDQHHEAPATPARDAAHTLPSAALQADSQPPPPLNHSYRHRRPGQPTICEFMAKNKPSKDRSHDDARRRVSSTSARAWCPAPSD